MRSDSTIDRRNQQAEIAEMIRDAVVRASAIVGLAAVALIHLLDTPDTFQGQPYKGWLYVALIAGCVAAAAALCHGSDLRAWIVATLLPLGAIVGFVVSRTIGLPGGADDIGNWSEPLGLAALFVEGSLVSLGLAVLGSRTVVAGRPARQAIVRQRAVTQ